MSSTALKNYDSVTVSLKVFGRLYHIMVSNNNTVRRVCVCACVAIEQSVTPACLARVCFELVQAEDDSKHWVDMPIGVSGQGLVDIVRAKLAIPAADSFLLEHSDRIIGVRKGCV